MKKIIFGLILGTYISFSFASGGQHSQINTSDNEHTEPRIESNAPLSHTSAFPGDAVALKKPITDLSPNTQDEKVVLVGYFSNQGISMVSDSPHISGYSLELYRLNNQMYGRFIRGTGSEDPVTTSIYDTKYDKNRGHLVFKAKLSEGIESDKNTPEGRPSKDLYEFTGTIKHNAVAGKIEHKSGYEPDKIGQISFIKLVRNKDVEKIYKGICPKSKQELEKYLSEMSTATDW
jgi:hypothetical protein